MTKVTRTSIVVALVIGIMLGGATLITARNNAAMNSAHQETPSGFLH